MPSLALARRLAPPSVLAVAVLALTSCGGGGPRLYPVKGQVLYQDKPAEGVTVAFHPIGGEEKATGKEKGKVKREVIRPTGFTGPDGSFTLSTYPHGEGAPAGEYVVVMTWFPPDAREQEGGARNKLPDLYADPEQSPLKATIQAGSNQLEPFRLKK